MSQSSNTQPIAKYRDGSLEIAIWKKVGEKGISYQTSGVIRSYKDQADQWQQTGSLSNGEIPRAIALMNAAQTRILELRTLDAEARTAGNA